jgi:hypothetical protein
MKGENVLRRGVLADLGTTGTRPCPAHPAAGMLIP